LRVLYVVSRQNPALFDQLGRTLQRATVEMIFDRRTGDRRRSASTPAVERRMSDRRRHKIDDDLERFGWAEIVLPDDGG
jgi:hypothetical protein